MTAILREDPPPLPDECPLGVRKLMRKCLEKVPGDRFQSAGDLAFALETLSASPSEAPGRATGAPWALLPVRGVAITLALALVGFGGWAFGRRSKPVVAPSFEAVTFRRGMIFQARFGTGSSIFLGAALEGGAPDVYEARLESPDLRSLGLAPASLFGVDAKGELAVSLAPRFRLSFMQLGRLGIVPQAGGAVRELAENVNAVDTNPRDGSQAVVRLDEDKAGMQLEWPLGKQVLRKSAIGSMRFSPDGSRLAFFSYGASASGPLEASVIVIGPEGTPRVLATGYSLPSGGLAWSPDGREVWFSASEDTVPTDLRAVPAVGGTVRRVLTVPGGVRLQDIAPDGRVLVLHKLNEMTLHVESSSGGVRDVSWFNSSFLLDLSSDGRSVLFSDQGGKARRSDQYLRQTEGSPAVRLASDFGLTPARLSPNGRLVASRISVGGRTGLSIAPVGAGDARRLSSGRLSTIGDHRWLPDGSALLLEASENGLAWHLYRQDVSGSADPVLVSSELIRGGGSVLSPDGRTAATYAPDGSIRLIPLDGSPGRPVSPSEPPGQLIAWTSDSRSLVAYREGEVPLAIRRVDLATGVVTVARTLMPADPTGVWRIHPVAITPDGRTIAYTTSREMSRLYVYTGLR